METLQVIVLLCLLANPPIPQEPADGSCNAAPANNSHWTHALLVDAYKAYHEYDDGTDVLDNDGRVSDEGPEVVGFQARIALEVLEECRLVGVVVGICSAHQSFAPVIGMLHKRRNTAIETYTTA